MDSLKLKGGPNLYNDKYDLMNKAKDLLKEEMTTISYTTWIKSLEISSIKDNMITLVALSEIQKEHIKSRLFDLIVNTFNFITNKTCEINIVVKGESEENREDETQIDEDEILDVFNSESYTNTFLNPKYTFSNFVIGNNNKFAQAAAEAVVKAPAAAYNPLFIYGGVGLGKTHLMHAIGNEILKNNPSLKVLYVTSEQFINELVNSIKDANYKNELFKNKYRNIDVLLIDDIQFIAGKKMGQEEFFHTFDTLYRNEKQIVISSDKPPKDIPLLEERLKSRFQWGILADIGMPDYETRLAILRKKVQSENIIIEDFILATLAQKIDSNIREIEGALNKVVAYANLTHSPITIEIAEKAIVDHVLQNEKIISSDYIKEIVAKYFNISKEDLVSAKKSIDITYPRQIAMFLCRSEAQLSFPKIGQDFGGRDHTTVMHAVNKIEKEIKQNTNTKLIVDSLRNIIRDNN